MALNNLLSMEDYQKSRSHIFPSKSSLEWFLRVNREVLMELNALSWPTRRLMVNELAFDNAVLIVGQRALQGD